MSKEEEVVNPETGNGQSQQSVELQSIRSAYRLNGKNYLKWAQLIRSILKGKGKVSHLTEAGPKEEDPKFPTWDEEDSTIMAWLWKSTIPEISDTCMFLDSAKKIRNVVEQTHSKAKDAAQEYDVKVKLQQQGRGTRLLLNMLTSSSRWGWNWIIIGS